MNPSEIMQIIDQIYKGGFDAFRQKYSLQFTSKNLYIVGDDENVINDSIEGLDINVLKQKLTGNPGIHILRGLITYDVLSYDGYFKYISDIAYTFKKLLYINMSDACLYLKVEDYTDAEISKARAIVNSLDINIYNTIVESDVKDDVVITQTRVVRPSARGYNRIISEDDIINIKIALNTMSVDEFLETI